jgi:colanic acid biosynthesis glycosyl transferase WcaI
MTRIVFILGFSLPFPGAGWRRVEYFAKYVSSRGFEVYILGAATLINLLFKLKRGKASYRILHGRQYSIMNIQPSIGLKHILARLFDLATTSIIAFTIILLKPRVVVVSVPSVEQVWASYIGAHLIGAKLVVDIRDPDEDQAILASKGLTKRLYMLVKRLNFAIYSRADAVITVTRAMVKYLARHGVRAFLAPNGADLKVFKPYPNRHKIREALGMSDSVKVIVFNGYLGEYYRIDSFLEALAEVIKEKPCIKSKIKVMIVGGIRNRIYARTFANKVKFLGIEGLILNLEVIEPPERLAQILSTCDIGLVPLISDPLFDHALPVKFYEYVTCGLPVFVLSRKGSEIWNTVEQYNLGYVCQPEDFACIKRVVVDIAEENNVGVLRENALRMRKNFDRKTGADFLCRIIQYQTSGVEV